jgi:hypothetical protein
VATILSGMLNEPIDGQALASELDRAPARTEALRALLSAGQLSEQVSPLIPPLVWVYAHIGHLEELWLLPTSRGWPPLRRRIRARAKRARHAAVHATTGDARYVAGSARRCSA